MSAMDKVGLGECRSVTITCISETGWYDTRVMLEDIKASGGADANQWDKSWHADNAAGSASLVARKTRLTSFAMEKSQSLRDRSSKLRPRTKVAALL